MKKISLLLITLLAAGTLFAGGAKEDSGEKSYKVGISKIVSHPALDAVEKGIQDELADEGFTNVKYDLQNANGEMSTAASIANKFKAEKVDVAVGIATPTAQALVNALKDIPVVYSAVTDPVGAGIVASTTKGEKGVAGVSDMTPVKDQIKLLQRMIDLKTLGHIYSSGEANAVSLAKIAEQACNELGIKFVATTVTNSSEVKQAAQSIASKVDAIYVSTDNTVVSALPSIADVASKAGIPVMSADPTSAADLDILAAWGFDYYKVGRATGKIVAAILNGANTEDMPTVYMTDPADVDLLVNKKVAAKLGITIPEDIVKSAKTVIE